MTLSELVQAQRNRCPFVGSLTLRAAHYRFLDSALHQELPQKGIFDPEFVDYSAQIERDEEGIPVRKLATATDLADEKPRRACARKWAGYRLREFYESPTGDSDAIAADVALHLEIGGAPRTARAVPELISALYALAVDRDIQSFRARAQEQGLKTAASQMYQKALPEVQIYIEDQLRK